MITIDGSQGEGGGQILRSGLALAAITGQPVQFEHIRARRSTPGLQRQHLTAARAAARVCNGRLDGDELHSQTLTFEPQEPYAGDYEFDIGSAGSTCLVLQTVLPILASAEGNSVVTIHGGTHNPSAPPVEFLQHSLIPVLHGIGLDVQLDCTRHGFFPAGGGSIETHIRGWSEKASLDLTQRGKPAGKRNSRQATALIANLPSHVAEREARALKHALRWSHQEVDEEEVEADGPGNMLVARLRYVGITAVFSACGSFGKPAEQVARECANQVKRYLKTAAPVCEHLADQLLLPLAIGAGGTFRTGALSAHTRTNAGIIERFLGPVVSWTEEDDGSTIITVTERQQQ